MHKTVLPLRMEKGAKEYQFHSNNEKTLGNL